jgi:hypothetical protein
MLGRPPGRVDGAGTQEALAMITRRQWAQTMGALVFGLLLAVPAYAADPTGKWKAEMQTPDGQALTNELTLEAKGEKLTGTIVSSRSPEPKAIENGTVKGDAITFEVTRDFGGNPVKLSYSGTVKGDEMPLKVTVAGGDQTFEFEMVAKRQK